MVDSTANIHQVNSDFAGAGPVASCPVDHKPTIGVIPVSVRLRAAQQHLEGHSLFRCSSPNQRTTPSTSSVSTVVSNEHGMVQTSWRVPLAALRRYRSKRCQNREDQGTFLFRSLFLTTLFRIPIQVYYSFTFGHNRGGINCQKNGSYVFGVFLASPNGVPCCWSRDKSS